jgi:hypothetical protein
MLRNVLLVLLMAAVLGACGSTGAQDNSEDNDPANLFDQIGGDDDAQASADGDDEEAAVRLIVEGFGQRMQNVELLSGEVQSQIRDQYGSFASEDMIEEWLEEPSRAPGREVSSPWPARIEIFTIEEEGVDTYRVHAWVKYVDAQDGPGEASAEQPISLLVAYQGGAWVITNYATTGAYATLD